MSGSATRGGAGRQPGVAAKIAAGPARATMSAILQAGRMLNLPPMRPRVAVGSAPLVGGSGRRWRSGRPFRLRRHRPGRLHLAHQVVVPRALDLEMRGGAELDGLDHVVIDVAIDAGLEEFVE